MDKTKEMYDLIAKRTANCTYFLQHGVLIEDPNTTYIDGDEVEIGEGTIIKPNTHISGKTIIGKNNIIGPNTILENVVAGEGNELIWSHLVDTTFDNNNHIGPFCRMRGHAHIENNVKIGNFVEIKNGHLHDGAKSAHLTYLGDCEIGERTNIGCGTITANYDGYNKSRTTIGNDVFVGSGSTIIAPVDVEDNAFIAAGSTITKNIKSNEMAIARSRQENKEGYAVTLRNKAKAKKETSLKK